MTAQQREHDFTVALGRAALDRWGELPQPVQQLLFEKAATAKDDVFRTALATFLHEHHPRTAD